MSFAKDEPGFLLVNMPRQHLLLNELDICTTWITSDHSSNYTPILSGYSNITDDVSYNSEMDLEGTSTSFSLVFGVFVLIYFLLLIISWMNHPIFKDPRSPRLIPYFIPFVGSAPFFWYDMVAFLTKYSKRYQSDLFAAYVGGRTIIFCLDPFAASTITSGKIPHLSWSDTKFRLLRNAMQASDAGGHCWANSSSKVSHSVLEKHLMHTANLKGNVLKCQHDLQHRILPALVEYPSANESTDNLAWKRRGIMVIVGEAIYRTTAESLYGYRSFSTHEDFQRSIIFDKSLAFFTGIGSKSIQTLINDISFQAREDMVTKMKGIYDNLEKKSSQDKLSAFAVDMDNMFKEEMNHDDLTRYRYLCFAAAFMNTIPAGFWAFYEMMANKDAFEAVKREIDDICERKSSAEGDDKSDFFTLTELEEMECLDSIISETLRLRSTNKMLRVRQATEDFRIKLNLPLSNELHRFNVKKGTYFVSCPTLMHRDPEIFQDPLTFKWDRFLKGPDGKPPVFTKNGQKILRPVDAFGGGPTLCPGRRFARTEIKALISSLLINYDVRFPGNEIPDAPIDHKTIVNSGMPLHDLDVEVRRKSR